MNVSESRRYLDRAYQDLQAASSNLQQGFYRVSITRAYYAMLYATSALLASEGISRSKHSGVHAAFGERFVKGGLIEPDYAKMLGYVFDSRLDSDYDVEFVAECKPRVVLMVNGKIIADGPTAQIMTDMETLKQASVSPPEIAKVFHHLSRYGVPLDVIDAEEAAEILFKRLMKVKP